MTQNASNWISSPSKRYSRYLLIAAMAAGQPHAADAASPETVAMPMPAPADAPPLPPVNYPIHDFGPGMSNNVAAPIVGETVWIVEDGVQIQYFYDGRRWVFWDPERRAHYASLGALYGITQRRESVHGTRLGTTPPAQYRHITQGPAAVHRATSLPNFPARSIVSSNPGRQTAAGSAHMLRH